MPDQLLCAACAPPEYLIYGESFPELLILSGPSGSGKSTWCRQLVEQGRSANLVIGGLVAPPVFAGGVKVGIDLLDLLSGEKRRLAVRRSNRHATKSTQFRPSHSRNLTISPWGEPAIKTTHWDLNPQVLTWGNQKLRDLPPCDLVIIDELGPLEFRRNCGLMAGLELVDVRQVPHLVAVIRPEFLPEARRRWPWAEVQEVKGRHETAGGAG